MQISVVYTKIAILFAIIMIGFLLRAKKVLKSDHIVGLSKLIFYLTLPALILNSATK